MSRTTATSPHRTANTSIIDANGHYSFRPCALEHIDFGWQPDSRHNTVTCPLPRSGHRIVCNDTDLFSFGGFNPATRSTGHMLFKEFWRFNLLTRRWTLLLGPHCKDMPDELVSHAMCMDGDQIIVYGGTGFPFGESCSSRVFIVQPYAQPKATIRELRTSGGEADVPQPQYGQAILVRDGYLYVIGGTTGFEYSCDVHRLCFATRRWECLYRCLPENAMDDPLGRYRHEIVADAERIYVIGGGTSAETHALNTVPTFDLKTRKWQHLLTKPDRQVLPPGMPLPRKCHSCAQQTNSEGQIEVVLVGGSFEDNVFYDDMWILNLHTMRWKLMQALPRPLHFHAAALAGSGSMYIFGGIEKTGDVPTRTNHIYRIWTKVPKLGDIVWSAMQTLQPKLSERGFERLVCAGVPQHLVKRLKMSDRKDDEAKDDRNQDEDDDGEGSWRTVSSSGSEAGDV